MASWLGKAMFKAIFKASSLGAQVLEPNMYCHLVGLFATCMQRPQTSEHEKLQHLRHAWQVCSEARQARKDLDWSKLLDTVLEVYVAGGFAEFAVEMLPHYRSFGVEPTVDTWHCLLRMFGDRKDVGRFFLLWDAVPEHIEKSEQLYHLALEMALQSRSAQQTCVILEQMLVVSVFPSPQLAERLAKAGRNVIQSLGFRRGGFLGPIPRIHQLIGKFIALNKDAKIAEAKRETAVGSGCPRSRL